MSPTTLFGTIHGSTVLFQLNFTFIYSTFNHNFLVLTKLVADPHVARGYFFIYDFVII